MCIFCDIANGKIGSHSLYEDESVLVFFDVNPTSYGHCLVVPKEHCQSFLDCPEDIRNHVFEVAQKTARQLEEKLHCDGINLLSNMHEAAGQSVEHFHVHLIPRYKNDQEIIRFHPIDTVDFEKLKETLK